MSSSSSSKAGATAPPVRRVDPSTIQNKFLVGYQGWFTCGGDGEPVGPGHHGWLHWFNAPLPDGGRPNLDLWPDVSSYTPSELYPAPGLKSINDEQLYLFSSRHPKTVQRHFHWMAEHNVDGAFLQRFLGQCDTERGAQGIRRIRDEVGDRVKEAAEKEGRVFAIMYDISGVDPNRVLHIIERDWIHLLRDKCVVDSPNYLKEKGKPVIAIWGLGFSDAGHTPELGRAVAGFLRKHTPGGAYIMGGVPSQWRTSEGDADPNPDFLDVWLTEFDAISPWTVGRFSNEEEADGFANDRMKGDIELLKSRYDSGLSKKIDYIPVVLPGGSGYNLSEGKWAFNGIKRNGGRFLWQQIANAWKLGARIMYGAMWDEYDEGTAFLPVVPNKRLLPVHDKFPFLALDADGHDLPSDWYMRICGLASEGLRGERLIQETFPIKELHDYWSTRSKSKNDSESGGHASTSREGQEQDRDENNATQSYQNWLATQQEDRDEAPPPPYSLVADGGRALLPPDEDSSGSAQQPTSSPSVATPGASAQPASPASSIGPSGRIAQASSPRPATDDPVTALTSKFGKQTISGSPYPHPLSPQSQPLTHAASTQNQRPTPLSPTSQPQLPGNHNQTGSSRPPLPSTASIVEPSSLGPWSQAPWPTPEWNPHWQVPNASSSGQATNYQTHAPGFSTPSLSDPYHASTSPSPPGNQPNYHPITGGNALASSYPKPAGTEGPLYSGAGITGPSEYTGTWPSNSQTHTSTSFYPAGSQSQYPTADEKYHNQHSYNGPMYYPPPSQPPPSHPLPSHPSSLYPPPSHPPPSHPPPSHPSSYPPPSHPPPSHNPYHESHPYDASYVGYNQPYYASGYPNSSYPGLEGPPYVTYASAPPPGPAPGSAIDAALDAVGQFAGQKARIRLEQNLFKKLYR